MASGGVDCHVAALLAMTREMALLAMTGEIALLAMTEDKQRLPQTQAHSQVKWRRNCGCLVIFTPRMLAARCLTSSMTSAA